MAESRFTGLEIAVVGMAGRFPKARSVEALWDKLLRGEECISFLTDEELIASGVDPSLIADPSYVKAAGVVDDADLFDAAFFNYSPREASLLDPQQRLFLETAWAALEHAGYAPGTFNGAVGVYGGVGLNDYLRRHVPGGRTGTLEHHAAVANDKDFLATRVSYKLNLEGPSVVVQSACSTSLVAIHLASQALLAGECDMALAGGVTIRLPQRVGYLFQPEGMSSPDGHCRAFSARAEGCLPGNGGAIVVLKRLSDALKARDSIHAVIRGSALNNDGAKKVGYTAPRAEGQARVIRAALQIAEVDAATVGYLEAHGTGTVLGDPIEIQAATQAFREDTDRTGYCAVGTVKSNLGHMDAAAGVTGFIKTALAVEHGLIPPSLHCEATNPQIDFGHSPFFVNTALRPWEGVDGAPRRAGVSSFGVGGTNAHVVVEAPPAVPPGARRPQELLVVSAKTPAALHDAVSNLVRFFRGHPDANLTDVAFTLRNGRAAFRHRHALVCRDVADAVVRLSAWLDTPGPGELQASPARLVFMFPGQGSQYPGMCRGLYDTEPEFRRLIDGAATLLEPMAGFDLRTLVSAPNQAADVAERMRDTRVAQPAIFAVSYALARLMLGWGLRPAALIGHSIGEYVAACIAGVFAFEDGLRLVTERGRLMASVPPGAMLAVPLSAEDLVPLLSPDVTVAALNAPGVSVVAGPSDAIDRLAEVLRARGVEGRHLHTSHAFHSPMMDPILEAFVAGFSEIPLHPPSIPVVSNVTGTWITPEQAADPREWARHLRHTVRFSQGLETILADGNALLVEVGPGQTLTALARRSRAGSPRSVATTRRADGEDADQGVLMGALAAIWSSGHDVDWPLIDATVGAKRVPLPTYPFRRERHWIEPPGDLPRTAGAGRRTDVRDWFSVPTWKRLPPSLVEGPPSPRAHERWAIFTDVHGLGDELGARLAAAGHDVAIVEAGTRFDRIGERHFKIRPSHEDDYERLCRALTAGDCHSLRVVHCWTLESDGESGEGAVVAGGLDRGFFSLLFLTQALTALERETSCRLTIVSAGVHSVTGEEQLRPEHATVVAFCRTLPFEHPELPCSHLDVTIGGGGTAMRQVIVDRLFESLDEPGGRSLAIRGGYRWEQALAPVPLAASGEGPLLKERGVYLITGGMGGIGLTLAEHLARTARARLVLVGRTPVRREAAIPAEEIDEALARLVDVERAGVGPAGSRQAEQRQSDEALDQLCTAYALRFLKDAGVDAARGASFHRDDLVAACRVQPKFQRLFSRMLAALAEDGLATVSGSEVRFTAAAREWPAIETLRAEALARHPDLQPVVELLCSCGDVYHLALRGDAPALGPLFGEGADVFTRAVAAIRDRSDLPLCQALVRDLLSRLVAGPRAGTLRLLEVGGGQGLLTRELVPLCEGRGVEYHFTDIGRSFVIGAQREAAGRRDHAMRFGVLDISRPPEPQGFSAGSYDVVLAFNVLHATRSVRESLANARTLLAPGGLLVLQESVRPCRWVDFIWGLTDGWWAFEDEDVRRQSPLLTLDGWVESLREAGFDSIASFPREPGRRELADAGVVVARKTATASGGEFAHIEAAREQTPLVAALERLERLGSEVEVITADVSDRAQMQRGLERALARFGRIDGVVHAALVLDDGPMQTKTRTSIEGVFAPKIAGTMVLKELLEHQGLDFFVMFSSLVSVLGGAGQLDYCAASNFQDAFAHAERSLARSVVSIDWGAWREVGKAFRSAVERGVPAGEALPGGMSPAEGLDAFMRVLAAPLQQVLASPEDPAAFLANRRPPVSDAQPPTLASPPEAATAAGLGEPAAVLAPRNDTERAIADIWREVLGVERIGVEDNFFDLGGDSVISLQFIAKAKKAGLRFTNRQVFEHQTIAGLAAVAGSAAATVAAAASHAQAGRTDADHR